MNSKDLSAAVILAAGSSQRMGRLGKKELLLLDGRPVLSHSINTFLSTSLFHTLLITCPPNEIDSIRSKLDLPDKDQIHFTHGGATRQESVLLSLQWLANQPVSYANVLIHDGARPWVKAETIRAVFDQTCEKGASIPVEPSTSAMKTLDNSGKITAHLDRESTWAAQTPQGFHFHKILEAHQQAQSHDRLFIDDSELWSYFQGDVWTVTGNPENKKITYQGDIHV